MIDGRATRRATRRALASAQSLVPRAQSGVVVLLYHLVGGGQDSPVDLPVAAFRKQMTLLARLGRVLSLPDALESRDDSLAHVLTFDDAFGNFADDALPILEELSLPVTLYVPVGFIDGTHPSPLSGASLRPLSWSSLRELARHPLVHIASHGLRHEDLRALDSRSRESDLTASRKRLEDQLGIPVEDFAYPQAKWSPRIEPEVFDVYRTAAVAGGLLNSAPLGRRIHRLPIRRDFPGSFESLAFARFGIEERLADPIRRLRSAPRPWRGT